MQPLLGQAMPLECGVFTISLDFELIWGTLDLWGPEGFLQVCEVERTVVIDRLLELFAEFEIQATWCVLGHLFLDHCTAPHGTKHPEIVPPRHAWSQRPWFADDPCGTEDSYPAFYGRSLVKKLQACPVPQEIGCHSFSHVIFDDAGCSPETAASEVAACVRLARDMAIDMRSFAFPRNRIGHLDILRHHNFTCYRGPEPHWYEQKCVPGVVRRVCHLLDVLRAARPPVVLPEPTSAGVWNLPGSMIYFPMHGLRRFIPVSLRVKRALKGLDAAAQEKRIFHLWFHPINLATAPEAMFGGLRAILEHACALRAHGALRILPMAALVPASASTAQHENNDV